jgi:hypothetical protein
MTASDPLSPHCHGWSVGEKRQEVLWHAAHGRDRPRSKRSLSGTIETVMPSDNTRQSGTDRPHDHPVDMPGFPILENLSTDDAHWRRTTLASVLLAATAANGARHTEGPTRIVLALAALLCILPALSLALMTGVALLLRQLGSAPANGD